MDTTPQATPDTEKVQSCSGFTRCAVPYRLCALEEGVVLEEGPLKASVEANLEYLLAISDIDDMLYRYRRLAGIADPPGQMRGWEKVFPAHASQFLMGAGNTLRWCEHRELRRRVRQLLEGIKDCVSAEGKLNIPGVAEQPLGKNQWGYSIQMFAHGMVAAAGAGHHEAWDLLKAATARYYEMLAEIGDDPKLPLKTDLNYQGHIANLLIHFSPVGSPDDIRLAEKHFVCKPWLNDLAARQPKAIWRTSPQWPHCYEIVGFEAYLDQYRATGDTRFLDAMLGAWNLIEDSWEHTGGTIAICEHQNYPPKCYPLTEERHVGEMCGSIFWMRFNHRLHQLFPADERYMNKVEQGLYNVLLAGQDPTGKGWHYHLQLEGQKDKGNTFAQGPVPSMRHTCCEGNCAWLSGNLPAYLFSEDDTGLTVNLYHSSSVVWRHGKGEVRLSVRTRFPIENTVAIHVSVDGPVRMTLRLRIPSWCAAEVPITVNGQERVTGKPGTYLSLDRVWTNGNTVAFCLPFRFQAHRYVGEAALPGHERYAFTYGPLLLACVGPIQPQIPTISHDPTYPAEWLQPDPDNPLEFHIQGLDSHRFVTYWKLGNSDAFTCYPIVEHR